MRRMKNAREDIISDCVNCNYYIPDPSHKGFCLALDRSFIHVMYGATWSILYPKCPLPDATEVEKILYFLEKEGERGAV